MLSKIDGYRLKVGKCEAIWMFGSVSTQLITKCGVQVTYLTENVSLQVKDEVVREAFLRGLLFHSCRLRVITWIYHLLNIKM